MPGSNASSPERVTQTFSARLEGHFLTRYHLAESEADRQRRRLYQLAGEKFWQSHKDLDWRTIDTRQLPEQPENDPLCGFAAYEKQTPALRCQLSWQRHSMEISEILHGEQAALLVASQLVSMIKGSAGKLFISTQVSDEARHVEFFSHYLRACNQPVHEPSIYLQKIITQALESGVLPMKLSICHILIESLALARFRELRKFSCSPLMCKALSLILNDEARHVNFGTDLLKESCLSMPDTERQQLGLSLVQMALSLSNSNFVCQRIAREQGWDCAQLRRHLRHFHLSRPQLAQSRLRQFTLNLQQAGLMTAEAQALLQSLRRPTNARRLALQSG
ncbi:ferritin-like domain-containing protein [Pseudohongiella spirulinae]|uniref:Ferritin-like domain-containing protein n=1 Tax=Pseudohongiella spirulinae TaxID=1249552 RepID=A0A0S2KEW2_9GAMM|nr:ferritin-like domain-containing protein [Pseudohongiella spirulinae]ALO46849.1 hypothetical protein PS2015_2214 [Pseudohongiella spirulinae]